MSLLRLNQAELAYGTQHILKDASLQLERGDKVALIGRNGTGKSTLLKAISGEIELDDGDLWRAPGLVVASLRQALPDPSDRTLIQEISAGLPSIASGEENSGDWHTQYKVERMLELLKLPGKQTMAASSGGIRRRTMLAKALVGEPDILLLDEPTNHLDIDAIEALQQTLISLESALVLVSHDRTMVDQVASQIVELDRGKLTAYPGNFTTYLQRKAKADAEEALHNRKFDQILAEEEKWIRQGIKARRTRNEGRVRRLEGLRKTRAERTQKQGNVKLSLDRSERSGHLVASLEDVSFGYETPLIEHFSTQIMRGDRVAIIGANGCGKSTLIKLILGELAPTTGSIHRGTKLQTAYFDQQRSALNINETVRNNVSPGSDHVTINGKTKHIAGYLADFLFTPGSLNLPVAKLSGGERNRLLMAKLFTQPANLLVLDEPTNDLDMETLDLFEELLGDYPGTLLLVSHDRAFIDAVATSTIVYEASGGIQEYVGGFSQWQRQKKTLPADLGQSSASANQSQNASNATAAPRKKRLSYQQQRQLNALPEQIESLESEQTALSAQVSDGQFYQGDEDSVKTTLARLQAVSQEIESAYEQWEKLSMLE